MINKNKMTNTKIYFLYKTLFKKIKADKKKIHFFLIKISIFLTVQYLKIKIMTKILNINLKNGPYNNHRKLFKKHFNAI